MKTIFSILILLLTLAVPAQGSQFVFQPVEENNDREMRLVLEVAALRLEKLLGIKLPPSITVATVETQAEFDSLAGGKIPEWGAGAAIPQRSLIILRKPMMNRYPGNTADLLQHELAHLAMSQRSRGARVPRFIEEGFASWFAGEWTFSHVTTVAAAQITESIIPLRDIDEVNDFQQGQANLAYAQSYLVVSFIFKQFGELGFLDLVDAFAAGKNLDDAFTSTFNMPFWRFEADYRKFLADNYTLLAILSDMSGLWIVLAVVVVLGWILIRKRKQTAFDKWKEEERYQSTDFDYSGSDDEPWKDSEEDSTRY